MVKLKKGADCSHPILMVLAAPRDHSCFRAARDFFILVTVVLGASLEAMLSAQAAKLLLTDARRGADRYTRACTGGRRRYQSLPPPQSAQFS